MENTPGATAVWRDAVVVRLLRRWAAARECDGVPLQSLVELSGSLGVSAEAAVALDSFFQLTEGALERPLQTECCCSHELGSDERAILLALAAAPDFGAPLTSAAIPDGLSGPLAWAAASVRRLMGDEVPVPSPGPTSQCPFARI